MQARLEIGNVLLTAGMSGVFVQFLPAIMPWDLALGHDVGKGEATDAGKFGCLPERKETPRISAAASSSRTRSSAFASERPIVGYPSMDESVRLRTRERLGGNPDRNQESVGSRFAIPESS
jgi:hypothetical protein